ncbi:hypothetical protein BW686_01600 [Pseudomonas syringae]|uniref:Uncharacterized protein n=1 Tax=Pseudomonas syringae TaxID=317 RepID=A0A244EYB5_PSESX|nr:hypothetical protein BW686_01600 [Pseudomonas syringae]
MTFIACKNADGLRCILQKALMGLLTIVPTLCVGMQFVTLCVTRRFCEIRWVEVRLGSPFRPS